MDRKPERLLVAENQYKEFKKSGKKPSDFCKENLRMSDVKSYDYVFNYFSNSGILVEAIKEYHEPFLESKVLPYVVEYQVVPAKNRSSLFSQFRLRLLALICLILR